jgi:hypothetical protein
MIKISIAATLAALLLGGASRVAIADEAGPASRVEASPPAERTRSINADAANVALGNYGGNFEWLHGGHGLLVEASYFHHGNGSTSVDGGGAALGYRWHWRGRQNSGFLGVSASLGVGGATATDATHTPAVTYDLSVRTLAVVANLGKRWQFANGFNITARVGGGWARRTVATAATDPDAVQAAKDVEDLMSLLPFALDGELSAGYSF